MMTRREFMSLLAAASVASLGSRRAFGRTPDFSSLYEIEKFGDVHFMHFTDSHAQLVPIYFREPSVNIGIGSAKNQTPHMVGEKFLSKYGLKPGTAAAHSDHPFEAHRTLIRLSTSFQ